LRYDERSPATRYIFTCNAYEKYIQLYDRDSEHEFDIAEKYFFLQSIINNPSNMQMAWHTYNRLYRAFRLLLSCEIADQEFWIQKKLFLKMGIKKILWILQACGSIPKDQDNRIIGQYMNNHPDQYLSYIVYDDIQTILTADIYAKKELGIGIAYVCRDFEPVFLSCISKIDLLIISR
jgi:hypothetical protein